MCVIEFRTFYRDYYTYFFDHIEEFIALKDAIDATPDVYSLDGGGTTSLLGKYGFRKIELRLGDLITLYANGQWCDNKKNVFLYKILQFPPPGSMGVYRSAWNRKERKYEKDPCGFLDSETLFEQAKKIVEDRDRNAKKKKVPLEKKNELMKLVQPLIDYLHHANEDCKCLGFARPMNGPISEKDIKIGIETLLENCEKGYSDRVRYVKNNFPQIFDRAESKDLLMSAANHLSVLRFLREYGKTDVSDAPVIWSACKIGNDVKERLDLLFELGADINIKGGKEEPAIVYAARRGNVDAVRWLVAHGADVNVQDKDGDTPLIVAAKFKNLKAIRCLLQKGADVSVKNDEGETVHDVVSKRMKSFDWKNIPDLLEKAEQKKK